MTRKEFLDKEHDFVRGTDTDVVRFYHTTIMKIFDDIEKEKPIIKLRIKFAKEQEEKYLLEKISPGVIDGTESYKKELYWNKVKTYWENKLKGL